MIPDPQPPKTVLTLLLLAAVTFGGCASIPKPKPTLGQTVGGGIDNVIRWTSEGIKSVTKH